MSLVSIIEGFFRSLVLLGIGELIADPEHMKDYESEFITAHENEQDHLIKSGFNEKDTNLFVQLCAQHLNRERLLENLPKLELHHIDFKKVAHSAFFVEVVRCNPKYAIIKAPGTRCAYLLRKGKDNPNIGNEMFFFQAKFCYYVKEATSKEQRSKGELGTNQEVPSKNSESSTSDKEHRPSENSSQLEKHDTLSSSEAAESRQTNPEKSPLLQPAQLSPSIEMTDPQPTHICAKC